MIKALLIISAVLFALILAGFVLSVLWTPGTIPYFPVERTPDGKLEPIVDERLPLLLDKIEVVLKREKIEYTRIGPSVLNIPTSKYPSKARMAELEKQAGLFAK